MARSLLLALAVLAAAALSCRDDEQAHSSSSWLCTCQRGPSEPVVEIETCAPSAGEASQLALVCLEQDHVLDLHFCDCLEVEISFCEPGSCFRGDRP